MNILVTGASGFLGGRLARRLAEDDGNDVSVLVRRSSNLQDLGDLSRLNLVYGDLADKDSLEAATRGIDVVFHSAARVDERGVRAQFVTENVEATEHLLTSAQASGVSRFVFVSSPSALMEYDGGDQIDIDESVPYPKRYLNLYSETKAMAERMVLRADAPGFVTCALRPRAIWGPGDRSGPIVTLLGRAHTGALPNLSGGRPVLASLCHVDNIVDAAVKAAQSENVGGKAYFIADDEVTDVWPFMAETAREFGIEPPTRTPNPRVVSAAVTVLVFGGVVAASLPVAVGVLAVLGSLASLRVISEWFEVNVFAINVASLLALGLAIDYGLFVVSRFREEITGGRTAEAALNRTMATAGRTIGFSALLLVCAFAGTLVFPQPMLKSLGFGAMSAVAMASLMSLTVLPAALALLGTRIGKWTWRADAFERGEARARRFWGATTAAVLRRPGMVAVVIGALLLLLAAPLTAIKLGDIDHTALPADSKARATAERLADEFPAANSGVLVVVKDANGGAPSNAAVNDAVRELKAVEDVTGVAPLGAATDEFVGLRVQMSAPDRSQDAMRVVDDIRAVDHPGMEWQLGGTTASTSDGVDTIVRLMPLMLAVMAAATLILMFVAFGSLVLPIKAVVMAFLSLAATFGVLTLIFHNGFLAQQLRITPGPLAAGMVVLVISVVFGLSTDYEVFLLSRMVEARAEGADTAEAVMTGATRTGRVVTAAATLLILVTGAFTLSELTPMRFIGIGMITALLIDATLVRMWLVPALVKLMGRANWWPRTPGKNTKPLLG